MVVISNADITSDRGFIVDRNTDVIYKDCNITFTKDVDYAVMTITEDNSIINVGFDNCTFKRTNDGIIKVGYLIMSEEEYKKKWK